MIELKHIDRSYKAGSSETWVLRHVDLSIRAGDFCHNHGAIRCGQIVFAECSGSA